MRLLQSWPILLAVLLPVLAHGATATGSQTLSLNLGAAGKLAIVQTNVSLTHAGSIFSNFTGTVTVQYKIRTSVSTGSAFITARAGAEFSPSNGPHIGTGDLTYTCTGATIGTGCSGTQTVSLSSQTNVVTVGSGVCTGAQCGGANPNSVSTSLALVDSPVFKTGSYSTNLTFSISSL